MKPLELVDRRAIESSTRWLPCSSHHTFSTLWMWNTDERSRLARIGRNLVVQFTDFDTKQPHLTLIGNDDIANAAGTALAHGDESLYFVPEFITDRLPWPPLRAGPASAWDDYILNVAKLSSLSGRDLRYRRKAANQCRHRLGHR